jgi:hypothetical protein
MDFLDLFQKQVAENQHEKGFRHFQTAVRQVSPLLDEVKRILAHN